jgi:hypothetical protein
MAGRLGNFVVLSFLLSGVLLLAPGRADARILKRLDYESGNLNQWTYVQALQGRISVVTSPRRQGRYSARFVVKPGDRPVSGTGERSELVAMTGERPGSDSWWRWSTFFPKVFHPVRGTWNVFTQWHQIDDKCPPPIVFAVNTEIRRPRLELRVRGGRLNSSTCKTSFTRTFGIGRFRLSRWYNFRFHIKWAASSTGGYIGLRVNGRLRVRSHVPTLYSDQAVYLKQGFYRGPTSRTSVIYHDGLQRYHP